MELKPGRSQLGPSVIGLVRRQGRDGNELENACFGPDFDFFFQYTYIHVYTILQNLLSKIVDI